MTLVAEPRSPYASDERPVWREVEHGFWVANVVGEFLGTIESHGPRFFARDSRRAYVGEYASLTAAQRAVEASRDRS